MTAPIILASLASILSAIIAGAIVWAMWVPGLKQRVAEFEEKYAQADFDRHLSDETLLHVRDVCTSAGAPTQAFADDQVQATVNMFKRELTAANDSSARQADIIATMKAKKSAAISKGNHTRSLKRRGLA